MRAISENTRDLCVLYAVLLRMSRARVSPDRALPWPRNRPLGGWYTWLSAEPSNRLNSPATEGGPPPVVVVSGRKGANAAINGEYALLARGASASDARPSYQCERSGLFLYFSTSSEKWLISTALGDTAAPAFAQDNALEPQLIDSPWSVVMFGQVDADPAVTVTVPGASADAPAPALQIAGVLPPAVADEPISRQQNARARQVLQRIIQSEDAYM